MVSDNYLTAPQVAAKWKITRRQVQYLCSNKRIDGVIRVGNMWLIPKNAEKPLDKRFKDDECRRFGDGSVQCIDKIQ